ncbi:ATP-binding protein [Martelella mediterranea]|uniref:C4-dicarboxylate transport sensor protein DctB n=1 Tax=Martelella mediterranea DSM 17316 TaxID=1122214 RepID=A0A1U9Z2P8_9HYPH|nr:ATP-binding protein [Martelella mediterranea]AQZ51948.1 C4-dicarboxylate transport sensor protein DctB [Martelella mediterranea DSM 17316]
MAKFRVRARTIDMLGRQQIAGIPTALSELFKNAHDAYAKRAEVDYFRDERILVLRDDGLGMTRDDFEQRWLTLGTDSKVDSTSGLTLPPVDKTQKRRPILGEKGIGRLAIAVIGPQVLILTRARRNDIPEMTITAAFIHWGMFELPGIDLDEVSVPIRETSADALPDEAMVKEMIAEARGAIVALGSRIEASHREQILCDLDSFNAVPAEMAGYLNEPSLTGEGCGTHFYITPADSLIDSDIDARDADNKATRFEKHLIGFTNTMTASVQQAPPIITRFRDYVDEGPPIERLGERAFFTSDEFKEVDHHISGRFDQYGQFRGEIGVYHLPPEEYVLNWPDGDGRATKCGPFNIECGVLQGTPKDSLVPPDEYARLSRKLFKHGGLYIYKDGIRVQPYGDSDYDFIDIEKRRTYGASYYYYSYRRLMGVIELDGIENGELSEKAGREGFRENVAYRQFRSILMNFFLQTAADFFREDGRYSEKWELSRSDLQKNAEIRAKKAKQSTQKKRWLQSELTQFFEVLENHAPEREVQTKIGYLETRVGEIANSSRDGPSKALALMRVEKEAKDVIYGLQSSLIIQKPRGVGLNKRLNNEWIAYQAERERLDEKIFKPAGDAISQIVSKAATEYSIEVDPASRFIGNVKATADRARDEMKATKSKADGDLAAFHSLAKANNSDALRTLNKAYDELMVTATSMVGTTKPENLDSGRDSLLKDFEDLFIEQKNRILGLQNQVSQIQLYLEGDGFDIDELTESLEEELEELRDRRASELELAQIGLAISAVNHEFDKTVHALRDGFRRLEGWAKANDDLAELYQSMFSSFEHLNGFLSLFTQMDIRFNRDETVILGSDITNFSQNLFEMALKESGVELTSTEKFEHFEWKGFTSTFYPVFVNLIDNAIYWLQDRKIEDKRITLDVEGQDLLVIDNGPGISARDRENVFSLNFTRKPGGRGMGLYISRQALEKVGYSLDLDPTESGTVFRISSNEKA